MRKIIISISLLVLLTTNSLYSIDTLSIKYFPLRVGDFWVYNYSGSGCCPGFSVSYKIKTRVIVSFVRENHIYYLIQNFPLNYSPYNNTLIRTDSISGSLRIYDSLNTCNYYYKEKLVDSLSANINDSVKNCASTYKKCIAIDTFSIFNFSKLRKKFYYIYSMPYSFGYENYYFTRDFGITSCNSYGTYASGSFSSSSITLIGCKLNGIVYGDTSTTGVILVSNEVRNNYKLSQNYPNPFNPKTRINFDIPKKGLVKLKIFDILGREVKELANEIKSPGSYSVDFNASEFSSGVYFYRLESGDFTDIKKMVLLK